MYSGVSETRSTAPGVPEAHTTRALNNFIQREVKTLIKPAGLEAAPATSVLNNDPMLSWP